MCGRFAIATGKKEMLTYLQEYFNIDDIAVDFTLPRYNIAPGEMIPGLVADTNCYRLRLFKWGFVPWFAKPGETKYNMINAKAETVNEKTSFKEAFRIRRCLLPATGFFEWQKREKQKAPYYITVANQPVFALAALFNNHPRENGGEYLTCAVITTAASRPMQPLHHRMPVILTATAGKLWLNPHNNPGALQKLLEPYHNINAVPVGKIVNKPENDIPDCIKAIEI